MAAQAQFLGTVANQTVSVTVFTNQSANVNSPVLQNLGQSTHLLAYCTTGFSGTISLQAGPGGSFSNATTIASASYGQNSVTDTGCHVLQAGGYYDGVRVAVSNYGAGSISAWYTAVAAPIEFAAAALGSNGPTSPVACDKTIIIQPAQSTTTTLVGVFAGANIYICGMSISFGAATTTGTVVLEEGTAAGCASVVQTLWQLQVLSTTPQILPFIGNTLGALARTQATGHAVCVATGAITATATISVSYAQF
jgi:hypothetical protein